MNGDRERCLAAGMHMDGYLSKPIRPDQLRQVMDQVFNSRVTPRSASRPRHSHHGDGAVFDPVQALDRIDGDTTLLHEMARLFLDHSGPLLEELRSAVAGEDLAAWQQAAHKLRGSASILGATAVSSAALRLEGQEDARKARAAFGTLESEVARLCSVLGQWMDRASGLKKQPTSEGFIPGG